MPSVLITGANRGIGLGFVKEMLKEPSIDVVIATARNVEAAKDLAAIVNPKLHIVQMEVTDEQSVVAAVEKVSAIVDGKGLDLLINNAAIFQSLALDGDVNKATFLESFDVNCFGPLLVSNIEKGAILMTFQKFHGLLKQAAQLNGSAQIANISSGFGALAQAMMDAIYPPTLYAMSKAALNMLTRRLAFEWKKDNIRATAFTPGWVRTDMGSANATLSVEESTTALTKLIMGLTEEHNGEGVAEDIGPCDHALCVFPEVTCNSPYMKSMNCILGMKVTSSFVGQQTCCQVFKPHTTSLHRKVLLDPFHVSTQDDCELACNCARGDARKDPKCPPNGVWGEWTYSGVCPTTCGAYSNVTRTRACTMRCGDCPCKGASEDVGPCDIAMCKYPAPKTCSGSYEKSANYRIQPANPTMSMPRH
ncbi:hypothetical protein PRIPAC_88347 [Pristionchus pacificus]|uniref:Dehydrogenase n=1 Tax=Pristionchus pacificus TaxID=54126 RepID=A0A2A6B5T4_PRIPA|nr:hypothetical protein PRIPAC_88347 [Pristionchus pacificus]|eukprot:PDM61240.1 dehydrogenase [Pristionchus pacificus]